MYYLRPRGDDVNGLDNPSDFESIASTMASHVYLMIFFAEVTYPSSGAFDTHADRSRGVS